MELPVIFGISQHDFRRWMTAVGLFLAVVLFGWFLIHRWSGGHAAATAQPAAAALPAPPSPAPSALPQASQHAQAGHPGAQARTEWRVVAFTYNRENQAQKKASSLAQKYPALQPEVFSPNGRAPWLVTVGGTLEHDAAYALARKARGLGLPRDTYAQNYTAR
jgi:eukaryotic-like serine/threonine-protein kinase